MGTHSRTATWGHGVLAMLLCNIAMAQPDPLSLERLRDPDLDPGIRGQILQKLQQQAAGVPRAPETREAMFQLARFRVARPELATTRQIIAEIGTTTHVFPDDPRNLDLLPFLAELQLQVGDIYGAHQAFTHEYRLRGRWDDAGRAAVAAHTAVRALDPTSALKWTEPFLVTEMRESARAEMYLARLKAGMALRQVDVALDAVQALELQARDALRLDAGGLIAAADAYDSVGRTDDALRMLQAMSNVHVQHERRAEVLLRLARHHAGSGRPRIAVETLNQLIFDHPDSLPAWEARLELLAPEGRPMSPTDVRPYLEAARQAPDTNLVETICDTMFNRLLASGFPLEAFMAAVRLAGEDSIAAAVARQRLERYFHASLGLLVSRPSGTEIAGISQVASELELAFPATHLPRINQERARLGLEPVYGKPYDAALREARALFRQGLYDDTIERIRRDLAWKHVRRSAPPGWRASIGALHAESLWRGGEPSAALTELGLALSLDPDATTRRALTLLQADILFQAERQRACDLYRELTETSPTPWTRMQTERCATEPAGSTAPEGTTS